MQVPCDTEYPAFVSERTIKENTGNIDCDGCLKYVRLKQTHNVTVHHVHLILSVKQREFSGVL